MFKCYLLADLRIHHLYFCIHQSIFGLAAHLIFVSNPAPTLKRPCATFQYGDDLDKYSWDLAFNSWGPTIFNTFQLKNQGHFLRSKCYILQLCLDKRGACVYKNIILYFYSVRSTLEWSRSAIRENSHVRRSCRELKQQWELLQAKILELI